MSEEKETVVSFAYGTQQSDAIIENKINNN